MKIHGKLAVHSKSHAIVTVPSSQEEHRKKISIISGKGSDKLTVLLSITSVVGTFGNSSNRGSSAVSYPGNTVPTRGITL